MKLISFIIIASDSSYYLLGGGFRWKHLAEALVSNDVIDVNFLGDDDRERSFKNFFKKIIGKKSIGKVNVNSFESFDIKAYIKKVKSLGIKETILIVEKPNHSALSFIKKIKHKRFRKRIVYDCIDNWRGSSFLAKGWYSEKIEKDIIREADLVMFAAREQLPFPKIKNKQTYLLENAVNLEIFNPKPNLFKPKDLTKRLLTLIFVGTICGDWIDWKLIKKISDYYGNNLAINFLGAYNGECPFRASNMYFLQEKKNKELPAYYRNCDAGIIPFVKNEYTKVLRPLKVYEYIACDLPTVSLYIEGIKNFPNVLLAHNYNGFIDHLETIRKKRFKKSDKKEIRIFLEGNNWDKRIKDFLSFC